MTLLAFDTTSNRCGVLVRTSAGDFVLEESLERGHDGRLALLTSAALEQAGVLPRQLSRIVVAIGPGSFTGARVGVAFARGLALSLKIPAVGVTGLDALARTAPITDGLIVAAHDVRRGDVVWRAYRRGTGLAEPKLEPVSVAGESLDALRGGESATVIGSGAPLLAGVGRIDGGARQFTLAALADVGAEADPALKPEPFYHRPPDATPSAPAKPRVS